VSGAGERTRRVKLPAALAVALALIGLLAVGRGAAQPWNPAEGMLLRLHDLPPGYKVLVGGSPEFPFAGIECHRIEPANAQPSLAAFLKRYSPSGCIAAYWQAFPAAGEGPDPLIAGTGALRTSTPEAAAAAFSTAAELTSHLMGNERPRKAAPPQVVGDASTLLVWKQRSLFFPGEATSIFVWRSGNVAAAVLVTGGTAAENSSAAVQLAQIQQRRIESPSPYTEAERDDREVSLENPALDVPIYWLGRRFAPGGGLQPMRLLDSESATDHSARRPAASLLYIDHLNSANGEALSIGIWSERQWQELRQEGKRLPASLRCAETRHLDLAQGTAVVTSGFERVRGSCPKHRRRVYTARVRFGDAIVTAETMALCAVCASSGDGPYDSFKGMAAVVRGLERRLTAAEATSAAP
jgi:hypothetical protein